MYVNTKTRLMCDLMGPRLRLLFEGGFNTRRDGMLDMSHRGSMLRFCESSQYLTQAERCTQGHL